MHTKYEVSMSNPVPRGGVHRQMPMMMMHDGQSMTV